MNKKRKETPQSATLLDFFGKGATPTPKKRKHVSPITPRFRPLVKKRNAPPVPPEEIIEISDSDEEIVTDVKPGPMESSNLSERFRSEQEREPSKASTSKQQPTVYKEKTALFLPDSDEDKNDNPEGPFGQSSPLLRSRSPSRNEEDADFGPPFLLLDPEAEAEARSMNVKYPLPPSEQSACPSPVTHAAQPIDDQLVPVKAADAEPPAQTNEWGTGDDEMDIVSDEIAAVVDEDFDDPMPPITDTPIEDGVTEQCPICDAILSDMSSRAIQEHVNVCIDGTASEMTSITLASESSESRQTQPPFSHNASTTPKKPSVATNTAGPSLSTDGVSGLLSVLMSSHKENEAWKEAAVAEDRNFRPTKANGGRRKAPFYKVLQGMPIAVDAFRYGSIPGVNAYFLTHAHSDHYTNLSANWKTGPIYCSEGTANLIMHMLGVDSKWVNPLPFNIATEIPDTGGVTVTLIEANHCPGSSLFLFEGQQTVNAGDSNFKSSHVGSKKIFRYLHCGDFRASPQHVNHTAIRGKYLDHVYLDTSYLDPKYCFPPQSQVISACAELARRLVSGESVESNGGKQDSKMDEWVTVQNKGKGKEVAKPPRRTLVVVGTYSIGKERIVKAIAKALNTKVYSDARKTAILRCQSDAELDELLTSDPLEAGVHLLPLGTIASDKLKIYMERWSGHFSKAIGFRPTGWTFTPAAGSETLPAISTVISRSQSKTFDYGNLSPMKNSTPALQMYGVPYSEHSSFFELTCFALSLNWGKMIATVNVGSERSRGKMSKWVERWEAERKKRGNIEIVPPRDPDYW